MSEQEKAQNFQESEQKMSLNDANKALQNLIDSRRKEGRASCVETNERIRKEYIELHGETSITNLLPTDLDFIYSLTMHTLFREKIYVTSQLIENSGLIKKLKENKINIATIGFVQAMQNLAIAKVQSGRSGKPQI
jgi:hypothetical protein